MGLYGGFIQFYGWKIVYYEFEGYIFLCGVGHTEETGTRQTLESLNINSFSVVLMGAFLARWGEKVSGS